MELDESSFANIHQVITQHYFLNLTVDFNAKKLIGSNTLTFISRTKILEKVILDAHHLDIQKVVDQYNSVLNYEVVTPDTKRIDLG